MVEFYLLTFPRFSLRKKEHKSYFGKNRTHDFRTSRCADYLLDHSGDESASLKSELQKLKNAISMPAESKPWQKTMDFVDGLKGKLPDEELAVIKRYVDKRSREAT